MRNPLSILATITLIAIIASPAAAQVAPGTPVVADSRLRVFLDCPTGGCDRDFLITDLSFVLWTQDRLDSDVHLLITRITTGSGGGEYTVAFNGRRRFVNRVDTLRTFIPPNSSDDMRRREVARIAKIGLLGYAARLPGQERFTVNYAAPATGAAASRTTPLNDPWNLWVHRLRANGSGSAESRSSNYQLSGSVSSTRTTEIWKVAFYGQNEYRANRFKLSDSTERRFILRSADASARVVRSLSDHWSVGSRVAIGQSEFSNQDANAAFDLSAEYNWFPWQEATSRQLIALVSVGSRYYDYHTTTIFDRDSEHRPIARAILAGESRQTWGTIDASLRYTRFLHDNDSYSIGFNGRTNLRISRGLSLELRGEATKVNDQLYLPRGDASDDEVLTRQRALATAYRLNGSVGLTFTFGSIYNTIVNPRIDEPGGGGQGGQR